MAMSLPPRVSLNADHSASVGHSGSPGRSLHLRKCVEEAFLLVPSLILLEILLLKLDWSNFSYED